nr:heavy metal-associated domain-containing protein [uncultured Flavobacterium sp.]
MKKYIFLAFATLSLVACNEKTDAETVVAESAEVSATTTNLAQPKTEIVAENLATSEFKIEGMTCQMGCANLIQDKLQALNGVANATVSFDEAKATVSYDKTVLTEDALKNTVNTIADGKLYKVVE